MQDNIPVAEATAFVDSLKEVLETSESDVKLYADRMKRELEAKGVTVHISTPFSASTYDKTTHTLKKGSFKPKVIIDARGRVSINYYRQAVETLVKSDASKKLIQHGFGPTGK